MPHKPILAPGLCECGCGQATASRYAQHHDSRRGPVAFWSKVPDHLPDDGCWPWQGAINEHGYGRFGGRLAHRSVYEVLVAKLPDGLQLDHLCRNRACVNPQHLEPVTSRENTLRGENRASQQARQTHCKNGHLLSGDNLYLSRDSRHRRCRTCRREYNLQRRRDRQ